MADSANLRSRAGFIGAGAAVAYLTVDKIVKARVAHEMKRRCMMKCIVLSEI